MLSIDDKALGNGLHSAVDIKNKYFRIKRCDK